jgi:hypothetical protein
MHAEKLAIVLFNFTYLYKAFFGNKKVQLEKEYKAPDSTTKESFKLQNIEKL